MSSVYVWGSNKFQQLIGQTCAGLHSYVPTAAKDPSLDDQVPIQVAAGDEHTLILMDSGEVFSYGGGKDGQLGNDRRRQTNTTGFRVQALENETVVFIAAGSHSSYAVTKAGQLYHWGLIHEEYSSNNGVTASEGDHTRDISDNDARSGALTGLAQSQGTLVAVDNAARQTMFNSRRNRGIRGNRQLSDIVRNSTDQWMLPTDDADQEYYEELRAMGYCVEDAEEKMQERGREYHGMLRMDCRRRPQSRPSLVPYLDGIKVVQVAAGYAHAILISDQGMMYAAGYNDRGQLGLGHRINTSIFKPIDYLSNKFIVQVSCGQQHSICRAVDRKTTNSLIIGSSIGADAYVWGNGMLGQLGLGRKGTSKGRLLPTLVPYLFKTFPSEIVHVAAGANFTAVIVSSGEVYSFGHAEYNQHGTGVRGQSDYVDPYHFFEPRKVCIVDQSSYTSDSCVPMASLSCGSVFSVGLSRSGELYSWGWNESGVLGHGISHFSAAPMKIESFGDQYDGHRIASVVCGAKHVVALKEEPGVPFIYAFRYLLRDLPYYDCILDFDGANPSNGLNQSTQTALVQLHCHQAVLAARSNYLSGLISASLQDRNSVNEAGILKLSFSGPHYNVHTMKGLLHYLYLNRINIQIHKRKELRQVASDLYLADLHTALTNNNKMQNESETNYVTDILGLFGSAMFADIVFVASRVIISSASASDSASVLPELPKSASQTQFHWNERDYDIILFAHKFMIQRISYFETFLESEFEDCQYFTELPVTDAFWNQSSRRIQVIDISGIFLDGISSETFKKVIMYSYSSQFRIFSLEESSLDKISSDTDVSKTLKEAMDLYVAANRLGFMPLAQTCERQIALALPTNSVDSLLTCLEFADYYNLTRLSAQCSNLLQCVKC